jgi:uncharacterized membrane protein
MRNYFRSVFHISHFLIALSVILSSISFLAVAQSSSPDYSSVASIFESKCIMCHSGPGAPKGLRLDSYQAIKKGAASGAVAIEGNAAGSELVKRIRGESLPRMPLTGPPFLSDGEIQQIAQWIDNGMPEGKPVAAPRVDRKEHKPGDPVTYTEVEPVFQQRCVKCHRVDAPNGPPEGLSLQSYGHITRGGERAVVIPGLPKASELVRRIIGIAQPRMPFDGPPWLSDNEITLIMDWIQQGARDKDGREAPFPVGKRVRLHGRLTGRWTLDGVPLVVDGNTRLKKDPSPGDYVRVRGYVGQDGRIYATRIRRR